MAMSVKWVNNHFLIKSFIRLEANECKVKEGKALNALSEETLCSKMPN